MKGTRFAGVALLVLAMMLVVIPTSGALAAKLLVLSYEGNPVANGSAGDTSLQLGECTMASVGKIVENKASKVFVKETAAVEPECPEGQSISGKIDEVELKASGKSALKGTVTITKEPGPCIYEFTKWKSNFNSEGFVILEGAAKGKLNKALSSKEKKFCPTKDELTWFGAIGPEPFGTPFTAAVES